MFIKAGARRLWWTLRMLPFSHQEFLAVFASYNEAIWPAQALAYLLGLACLALLLRPGPVAGRFILIVLSAMWAWTGVGYHGVFFAVINPAAYGFAVLFVLQGVLLAALALRRPPRFRFCRDVSGWTGLALTIYALALYPLIGALAGQTYPAAPMFGVAPCPVVLFTLGLLLLAEPRPPRVSIAAPALWALIGGSAAFLLGVVQDWPLLIAGLAAAALLAWRPHKTSAG
jgi:hypothetical protein